jgi:hypothetical protein
MQKLNSLNFWHYPRTELAERLINSINIGLVSSFMLFAPRRIGKTEFLIHDLKPLAQQNKYFVLYFNFYTDLTTEQNPASLFKTKLREAINDSIFDKVQISEVKLPWCTINLKSNKNVAELDVLELVSLLSVKLQKKGMRLLLMLDEIQELEFNRESQPLVAGLRTALDLNKEVVKVIFTGSSQAGLKKMFQDNKAPFFHFSTNLEFPLFDKKFTDFLANAYKIITNKSIDDNELYDIFCKLNKITLYIREVLNLYILHPALTLNDCYQMYAKQIKYGINYKEKWLRLTDAEKAILLSIARNVTCSFYSHEFNKFSELNKLVISRGKIQIALKNLISNSIINKHDKQYLIVDSEFEEWIKEQSEN